MTAAGRDEPRVAIVGGGLAGLAAAAALTEHGVPVTLLESHRQLGGRAGSYFDRDANAWIDHCQHVAMGCCTNFADFCRRLGIENLFRRDRQITFYAPDGRRYVLQAAAGLPAPLHLLPSLFTFGFLSVGERISLARCLMKLARLDPRAPIVARQTIAEWLAREKQSDRAIRRFWHVVLVSALSETLERIALPVARKVFVDGLLAHRDAYTVSVPTVPLQTLYEKHIRDWLARRGAEVRCETNVDLIWFEGNSLRGIVLNSGERVAATQVVLAVPWRTAIEFMPAKRRDEFPQLQQAANFPSAPIASLHLWFDRPILPARTNNNSSHAVLLDCLTQWVFAHGKDAAMNCYPVQVVVSAAHNLAGRPKEQVRDAVLAELHGALPASRSAKLLRWRLITQPNAVFSPSPEVEAARPPQTTHVYNLYLAGDWTATGWPATMESAVRSGYLAAEAILAQRGKTVKLVVDDLPRGWLARRLGIR